MLRVTVFLAMAVVDGSKVSKVNLSLGRWRMRFRSRCIFPGAGTGSARTFYSELQKEPMPGYFSGAEPESCKIYFCLAFLVLSYSLLKRRRMYWFRFLSFPVNRRSPFLRTRRAGPTWSVTGCNPAVWSHQTLSGAQPSGTEPRNLPPGPPTNHLVISRTLPALPSAAWPFRSPASSKTTVLSPETNGNTACLDMVSLPNAFTEVVNLFWLVSVSALHSSFVSSDIKWNRMIATREFLSGAWPGMSESLACYLRLPLWSRAAVWGVTLLDSGVPGASAVAGDVWASPVVADAATPDPATAAFFANLSPRNLSRSVDIVLTRVLERCDW